MRWTHLLILAAAFFFVIQSGADAEGAEGWTTAWMMSPQAIPQQAKLPPLYRAPDVAGRTVRQIIYPTLSGDEIRLHISNRYGSTPLDVLETRVARSAGDVAATRGTSVQVTFGGKNALHLPPGGEADSDPVKIKLIREAPYAISLYLGPNQRLQAWHRIASQENYVSVAGNHAADVQAMSYRVKFSKFAWVTSLSVAHASATAVVAIGDSITDGLRSSMGLNRRWPDILARRIADAGSPQIAVLNAGISGNRLLSDSRCYGERLVARFEREITGLAGIDAAILLVGINDINFAAMPPRTGLDCDDPHNQVSAEDLIAGYRQLLAAAHRHHIRLLIGTLTPADLPPAREKTRLAVNQWIRDSKDFDGVIDFDKALRDPTRPQELIPAYDSGDHVHPSDTGYATMAQAVPLQLLRATPGL